MSAKISLHAFRQLRLAILGCALLRQMCNACRVPFGSLYEWLFMAFLLHLGKEGGCVFSGMTQGRLLLCRCWRRTQNLPVASLMWRLHHHTTTYLMRPSEMRERRTPGRWLACPWAIGARRRCSGATGRPPKRCAHISQHSHSQPYILCSILRRVGAGLKFS